MNTLYLWDTELDNWRAIDWRPMVYLSYQHTKTLGGTRFRIYLSTEGEYFGHYTNETIDFGGYTDEYA